MIEDYMPLIYAIIEALLFLESSGPDEVDSHSAVRCMESISSSLLALGYSDQLALRAHLVAIADEEKDPSYRDFVRALPDMIGLAASPSPD
jgi:hypothetical protein